MGISRRQFLLSTSAAGAGFILPSYFDKAVDVLAQTGEPLIIPPEECLTELIAVDQGFGEFQLNIGDPWEDPPRMTLREFIDRYFESDVDAYIVAFTDGEEVLCSGLINSYLRIGDKIHPGYERYRNGKKDIFTRLQTRISLFGVGSRLFDQRSLRGT